MSLSIEFDNLSLIFGKKKEEALALLDQNADRERILEQTGAVLGVADINLKIKQNEIFVLMGLSGSGKSSLLRCINGLNEVTRGRLSIHNEGETFDMAGIDKNRLLDLRMNHVSMVFQQFGLLPWATVAENVAFGLKIRKIPKARIQETVEKYLDMVQLMPWAGKPISQLSGGMRQRVGLARALATDAKILLMDEPFSALDPLIREHLQDELLKIQKTLKKTIVFVSHDLNEALKMGDKIAIMKDGKLVQTGSADEIVFRPVNDYVKRFVNNINPLTSLYACSLMKPVPLSDQRDTINLNGIKIALDQDGQPVSAEKEGQTLPIEWDPASQNLNALHVTDYESPLRDLIKITQTTPHPILVTERRTLVGILDTGDVFKGLTFHEP